MATLYSRIKAYLDANLSLSDFLVIDGRRQRGGLTTTLLSIIPGSALLSNIVSDDTELGRNFDWAIMIECERTANTAEENLELAIEDLTPLIIAYTDTNKRWQPVQVGATEIRTGIARATFGMTEVAVYEPGEF